MVKTLNANIENKQTIKNEGENGHSSQSTFTDWQLVSNIRPLQDITYKTVYRTVNILIYYRNLENIYYVRTL